MLHWRPVSPAYTHVPAVATSPRRGPPCDRTEVTVPQEQVGLGLTKTAPLGCLGLTPAASQPSD
jgi:hypothetical protein